jgi:hypothetical protein
MVWTQAEAKRQYPARAHQPRELKKIAITR